MRRAAGLFEGCNLIVKSLPFSAKHVGPGDDHVNVFGPRFDRTADLRYPLG